MLNIIDFNQISGQFPKLPITAGPITENLFVRFLGGIRVPTETPLPLPLPPPTQPVVILFS
jgi:hypothetical protein